MSGEASPVAVAGDDPSGADGASEPRARRALATGAVALPVGLVLVGVGPSDVGMVVTLAALLVLVYGVHKFGRLGPDPR